MPTGRNLAKSPCGQVRCIMPRTWCFVLLCLVHLTGASQNTNTQLWVDGILGKSFASYYMAECEFSYQTLLSDQGRWESLNASPSLEVSPTAHWSFLAGLPLSYTIQQEGYNTFELRAQFGAKYNFTPFDRLQVRLNSRYEIRQVRTVDTDEVQRSQRTRLRAEVVVPIDVRSYDSDSMWYALADAETFITMDQDVAERFANRTRFRFGVGRKFSYNWRAELIYTLQRSRDAISDEEYSTDNIIRLRIKYYFTPRSRSLAAGDNSN
jgi:hypothetical protein